MGWLIELTKSPAIMVGLFILLTSGASVNLTQAFKGRLLPEGWSKIQRRLTLYVVSFLVCACLGALGFFGFWPSWWAVIPSGDFIGWALASWVIHMTAKKKVEQMWRSVGRIIDALRKKLEKKAGVPGDQTATDLKKVPHD